MILAATLSSNYGIYGPVYEFGLNESVPGKEEYIDNEKYEIKKWDWKKYTKIKEVIRIINRLRKENSSLQRTNNINLISSTNQNIISYLKKGEGNNNLLIAVNLDPFNTHDAYLDIPLNKIGIKPESRFKIHDLLSGDKFIWQGERNYVKLNPNDLPAHIFKVEEI